MPRLPVLLVACPPWRTECPNLALAYLSAMLRKNGIATWVGDLNILLYNRIEQELQKYWELTSSTFWARPEVFRGAFSAPTKAFVGSFVRELIERDGELIGFSTQSANCMFTLEIVRQLRELGCRKTIVLGGPSVRLERPGDPRSVGLTGFKPEGLDESAAKREILPFLDLVDVFVEGEGEHTLLELAQRHAAGASLEGTPGAVVWNKGEPGGFTPRSPVGNLDLIPSPTFEEFDLAAYGKRILPFLTSRGCVRKCAMCYERILWPGYRHRGVDAIVEEMRFHIEKHGIDQFSCNDLLLNGNLLFLGSLCDAIAKSGLQVSWWGNAVVHRLMDRDLFRRMKAGRVGALVYGIESGSQKILRKMRKGYIIDDADQVLRYGAEVDIKNVINLMVGFPGETEDDHRMTMDFVRRNHDVIHHVGVLAMTMVYPHSPLSDQWEYYGIDPNSLEQFNPYSVNVDWKDTLGLDAATRQERFWQLFRLIRGFGIGVTGVEDEEELTAELTATLVEGLQSLTSWVREDAIVRLARGRDPALIPVMESALEDESFLVAGQALLNLSRLAPDRAWKKAAPLIRRGVSYVEYAAAMALSKRRDSHTLDLLEDRLTEEKFARHGSEMQEGLAWHRAAYARFEDFTKRLDVAALLADEVEWTIVRSLRWLREEAGARIPALRDALLEGAGHPSAPVRRELLRALQTLGEPIQTAALMDECPAARCEAAILAGAEAPEAWPAGSGADTEFRRLLAVRGAARHPRPASRTLLFCRALMEGSGQVRLAALETLEAWQDWRYVEEAVPSLEHADRRLRRAATRYLGRAGDLSYQTFLLPRLHDEDLFVAQEATAALASMRSAYVQRDLHGLLEDKVLAEVPEFVRGPLADCTALRAAIFELAPAARSGDDSTLLEAWEKNGPLGRVFLLVLLDETASATRHRRVLERALRDPEPQVRVEALDLIEELGDEAMAPAVSRLLEDPWPACRAGACRFLAKIRHGPSRAWFLKLLHDPDDYVKEWAARGIGRLGNREDVVVLQPLLQETTYAALPAETREDLAELYGYASGSP